MNDLKPCPFCGGAAERTETDDGGSFIRCTRCDASTAIHYDRRENLVSSWNDRKRETMSAFDKSWQLAEEILTYFDSYRIGSVAPIAAVIEKALNNA